MANLDPETCRRSKRPKSMVGLAALMLAAQVQGTIDYGWNCRPPFYMLAPQVQTIRRGSYISRYDILTIIQLYNGLMRLGSRRAMMELHLIESTDYFDLDFPYYMTRILFDLKYPSGAFPILGQGNGGERRTGEESKTYPFLVWKDVPFMADIPGFGVRGGKLQYWNAEGDFQDYLDRYSSEWTLRTKSLRPPDDPFLLVDELVAKVSDPEIKDTFRRSFEEQVLEITRTVFPKRQYWDERLFQARHAVFLKEGGHWDPKRDIYVRRDGSFFPDPLAASAISGYKFPKTSNFEVKVKFKDGEDRDHLRMTADCTETSGRQVPTAVLVVHDVKRNKDISTIALNSPNPGVDDMSSLERRLAEPSHAGVSYPMRSAELLNLGLEDPFELRLYFGKQMFKSLTLTFLIDGG